MIIGGLLSRHDELGVISIIPDASRRAFSVAIAAKHLVPTLRKQQLCSLMQHCSAQGAAQQRARPFCSSGSHGRSPWPIGSRSLSTHPAMPLCPLAATLLAAKRRQGLSFADLGARLGVDEVWLASLIHGQATANLEEADSLLEALAIPEAERQELREQLTTYPIKGALDPVIPTDPLLYRFHEILQVYGLPLKDVIQEKFGDGIMSAIDFTLTVNKVEDPKGDRVLVTMNGKFLPYRKW